MIIHAGRMSGARKSLYLCGITHQQQIVGRFASEERGHPRLDAVALVGVDIKLSYHIAFLALPAHKRLQAFAEQGTRHDKQMFLK